MFYDFFENDVVGTLILVGDQSGLHKVNFQKGSAPIPVEKDWIRDPVFFNLVKDQLQSYFSGNRTHFDLTLAPRGTVFQLKVWKALRSIPYGQLVTYKQIAERIGNPKTMRAVGGANGRNPLPVIVPCHRVIGSNGKLTGFGGGLDIKQRLIDFEKQNTPLG